MSVTRDTPLGTLTVVPDPVSDGDVVDFPRPRRDEDEPDFTRAALQRSAESAVPLLACAAENYANPHAPLAHKLDVALAGLDASIAVLADYRRSHERPNLRVVGDSTTGGVA